VEIREIFGVRSEDENAICFEKTQIALSANITNEREIK